LKTTVGLIVNTYNRPDYLGRVLGAVARQTTPPEEVLLADDGSDAATRRLFSAWAAAQRFATHHAWHEKDGFRRSRILNLAVAQARSDYLIFLDGDTIPHPRFVADHGALARPGHFVQGHRALVTRRASAFFGAGEFSADRRRACLTRQLRGLKHVFRWPAPFCWVKTSLDGVRGCNLSAWRADLIRINGYNEDYIGWGCEDLDLALRLMNSGVRRLDIRGHALCYHLWHPRLDRSHLEANQRLLRDSTLRRRVACEHGLKEHLDRSAASARPAREAEPPTAPPEALAPLAFDLAGHP
jgi:glycosyltransferase involved in cell wall biosynthesis